MRPASALNDFGHERRILGGNVLVVKRNQLLKAEHFPVELYPFVHFSFFNVPTMWSMPSKPVSW